MAIEPTPQTSPPSPEDVANALAENNILAKRIANNTPIGKRDPSNKYYSPEEAKRLWPLLKKVVESVKDGSTGEIKTRAIVPPVEPRTLQQKFYGVVRYLMEKEPKSERGKVAIIFHEEFKMTKDAQHLYLSRNVMVDYSACLTVRDGEQEISGTELGEFEKDQHPVIKLIGEWMVDAEHTIFTHKGMLDADTVKELEELFSMLTDQYRLEISPNKTELTIQRL